jgi:hypothetical protein
MNFYRNISFLGVFLFFNFTMHGIGPFVLALKKIYMCAQEHSFVTGSKNQLNGIANLLTNPAHTDDDGYLQKSREGIKNFCNFDMRACKADYRFCDRLTLQEIEKIVSSHQATLNQSYTGTFRKISSACGLLSLLSFAGAATASFLVVHNQKMSDLTPTLYCIGCKALFSFFCTSLIDNYQVKNLKKDLLCNHYQFILIDEVQNLTMHEVKTRIVFVDNRYLVPYLCQSLNVAS